MYICNVRLGPDPIICGLEFLWRLMFADTITHLLHLCARTLLIKSWSTLLQKSDLKIPSPIYCTCVHAPCLSNPGAHSCKNQTWKLHERVQKFSIIKGKVSGDFWLQVFSWIIFPWVFNYPSSANSNFSENFVKIFVAQGAPPVSTTPATSWPSVSLKPAANLPPVSTTPVVTSFPVTPAANLPLVYRRTIS